MESNSGFGAEEEDIQPSVDPDISRMTYIQAPKDEPLNLNMAEFEKQP